MTILGIWPWKTLHFRIGKSHPNIFWRLLIETAIVKQYEMQPIVHDFRVILSKMTEKVRIMEYVSKQSVL